MTRLSTISAGRRLLQSSLVMVTAATAALLVLGTANIATAAVPSAGERTTSAAHLGTASPTPPPVVDSCRGTGKSPCDGRDAAHRYAKPQLPQQWQKSSTLSEVSI